MKSVFNKNTYAIIGIILAIPFVINFLDCIPAPYSSWMVPSEWTKFWGQYLSGFAAFAMLYVAWKTFHLSKDTNRPYLIIDIVEYRSKAFLRCRNVGHNVALNIKMNISQSIINQIEIGEIKTAFEEINKQTPFILEPNGKKEFELFWIPNDQLEYIKSYRYSQEATYPFKGTYIEKSKWNNNIIFFETHSFVCQVEYNDYKEDFTIDYNNRVGDIEPLVKISDRLLGLHMELIKIQGEISKIATKGTNGTEQTK